MHNTFGALYVFITALFVKVHGNLQVMMGFKVGYGISLFTHFILNKFNELVAVALTLSAVCKVELLKFCAVFNGCKLRKSDTAYCVIIFICQNLIPFLFITRIRLIEVVRVRIKIYRTGYIKTVVFKIISYNLCHGLIIFRQNPAHFTIHKVLHNRASLHKE